MSPQRGGHGRGAAAIEQLVADLAGHQPGDEAEARSLSRSRALVAWLPAPFDQRADPTHVTASAIVIARHGTPRVLLHRHKRLRRWLQPGGHLEADEQPHEAALREVREETGIRARHPAGSPRLIHVDVHEGPRGHVHLDLRYLLLARAEVPAPDPGESGEVAWTEVARARSLIDRSTQAALIAAQRALEGPAPGERQNSRG